MASGLLPVSAVLAAALPESECQQEGHQHQHADHLHDHRMLGGFRAKRIADGHHLRHFMHRRTDVAAEMPGIAAQPAEQQRIEQHRCRAEQHHGGDGGGGMPGAGFFV